MNVHFYLAAVKDDEASDQAGYPIYREIEKVKISGMLNGDGSLDNTFTRDTQVTDQHRRQWPDLYAAFKASQKETAQGTPIKMWPAISIGVAHTLAEMFITTVEQLAEVDAKDLRQHEWLKPLRDKAVSWLKSIDDSGVVLRLEARIEELERQLESKMALIASLSQEATTKKRTSKTAD